MTSSASDAIVRVGLSLIDAWNAHDSARIAAIHSPDFSGTDVGAARPVYGQDGARCAAEACFQAFPDLYFDLDDTIADGDRVVLSWTARGTHSGAMMHIPPTQRTIQVRGVWTLTVVDDRIESAVCIWDVAGMLRGFGLLPDLS